MGERDEIVAVSLLTARELSIVGQSLKRVYRIDEAHGFDDLLNAIDIAEQQHAPMPPAKA